MKLTSLCAVFGLTTLTLVLSTNPSFSQDAIKFSCQSTFNESSGKNDLPTTVAYVPRRGGYVRVIGWKSKIMGSGWNPQKRCQVVSQKFQDLYTEVKYLTIGKNNGYDVICAVKKTSEYCNNKNQLFTVNYNSNPQTVLLQLTHTLQGGGGSPILQNGAKIYVKITDLLENGSIVEVDHNQ